jgi:alginate O-acetyltransferase complex protein AlgJ
MAYENRAPIARHASDLLLIVGFLAISSYPAVSLVMKRGESPTVAATENRLLARRPSLSLLMQRPHRFAKAFKVFFDDQFETRNQLVRLNSLVRYRLLRVCSNPSVIPGKHGTLFYAGDDTVVPKYDRGNELVNYRRIRPLTEYQLRRIAEVVDRRRAWAASIGAKFLFVITPDKSTIYPELLPASLNRVNGPSPTDQIVDYLHDNTSVNLVDLRGRLIEKKQHGPLYLARDTHWNDHGAFVGYQAVAEKLHDLFPQIEPLSPNQLTRSTIPYAGDLTKMLNLGELLEEQRVLLRPTRPKSHPIPFPLDCPPVASWQAPPLASRIEGSKLPKALVYHDSMVYVMMPYLSEHFETAIYIRDLNVNLESVKNYHPDIVIHECLERMLQYYVGVVDDLRPEHAQSMIAAKDQPAGPVRR